MSILKAYGNNVNSIFQLIGDKENDITKSIAWALNKCNIFLMNIVYDIFKIRVNPSKIDILYQSYDKKTGITDIEITDYQTFYIIIEAKRGWSLPSNKQLTKYSLRDKFIRSDVPNKAIVSMSECNEKYATVNLLSKTNNGILIKHLSWQKIYDLADRSKINSNNAQKRLLEELKIYLGGIMKIQTKDSNWVYIVSLSTGKPKGCNISFIDIVSNYKKYFHVVGKNWPKEPPNYIAFRYYGKLQSIHHIDKYVISKNIHDEIKDMPDKKEKDNFFVYHLGPAIIPQKEVKTGKIYPNGRVWAMLDTLLTSDTISYARDISKRR